MSNNQADQPTILLLGDSITSFGDDEEGFSTLLREYYKDTQKIVNLGKPGFNTRNYLSLM